MGAHFQPAAIIATAYSKPKVYKHLTRSGVKNPGSYLRFSHGLFRQDGILLISAMTKAGSNKIGNANSAFPILASAHLAQTKRGI